jgi:hypothetical protein
LRDEDGAESAMRAIIDEAASAVTEEVVTKKVVNEDV